MKSSPPATGPGRHRRLLAWAIAALGAVGVAQAATPPASTAAATHPTRAFWRDMPGTPAATSATGAARAIQPQRLRAAMLDKAAIAATAAGAPSERGVRRSATVVSLPDPDGGFQRFTIVESPVMEPALAARHPEIKTYAGRGLDDTTATLRMSITPLGLQASVRSKQGHWYIDPYYQRDDSVYVSYFGRDLPNTGARLVEAAGAGAQVAVARGFYHAAERVQIRGAGFAPGAQVTVTVRNPQADSFPRQVLYATADAEGSIALAVTADPYKALGAYAVAATDGRNTAGTGYQVVADNVAPLAATGSQLRTYRLALLTDPGYANYHGAANVTAAKAALINRVTQIYETETSIRLVLIGNNDVLNLDTAAQFSGANGPCGGTACFPTASVSCSSTTLTRTRVVIGLLVGARNFDIGHIGVGAGGGGIASLGVVGGNLKAQGCTGLPTPTGDLFAVDYVAHEMGHQFAGNHTFNSSVCSANRNPSTSVEPGSGSSIMAYAGICGNDNLQPHSDAYWSQRSFDEIVAYISGAEGNINEVQMGVLSGFATNGQQFQLRFNGTDSAPIVRGTNFTTAGVKAAIEGIAGWPAGGTVTVSTLGDTAFTITFGGALAGTAVNQLELVNCSGGCTGYVGEIAQGGLTARGGSGSATGNTAPAVSVAAASYTIPVRTPFALTGSATDTEGDALTYLWEQTDSGASAASLISNTKTDGPLFRQFGTRAVVSATDTLLYNSPGENIVGTSPTRVFPDLAQIIANNTNAETGACPTASSPPTGPQIDCFSEFLPTAAYVGAAGVNAAPARLNFKLTARDGRGGVNSAVTALVLAPAAGPFLVTSPNTAVTLDGYSAQTVTWAVANTDVAPVGTANVKITLSLDSGLTFPVVLAASTPNTGSGVVTLPNVGSTKARVKVEAVGNVFFDVSNADFTIRLTGDVDGDGGVGCTDIAIVRAAIGTSSGQPGFDPRADVNNDGIIDVRDLAYVSQRVTVGRKCG